MFTLRRYVGKSCSRAVYPKLWAKVFPARPAIDAVDEFERFDRDKHLASAHHAGTPTQRAALELAAKTARGLRR